MSVVGLIPSQGIQVPMRQGKMAGKAGTWDGSQSKILLGWAERSPSRPKIELLVTRCGRAHF